MPIKKSLRLVQSAILFCDERTLFPAIRREFTASTCFTGSQHVVKLATYAGGENFHKLRHTYIFWR